MSLAILFHFLCAQHVSDINISVIRSLRLCCWITTSVVLFSVRCVLEIWCGWFWVVFVLQAEAYKRSEIKQQVTSSWSFILQLLQCCTVQQTLEVKWFEMPNKISNHYALESTGKETREFTNCFEINNTLNKIILQLLSIAVINTWRPPLRNRSHATLVKRLERERSLEQSSPLSMSGIHQAYQRHILQSTYRLVYGAFTASHLSGT